MPLTDMLTPRLVELGSIKIGTLGDERDKQGGGGKYRLPQKLDHFIITTKFRDSSGILRQDERLMNSLRQFADADGEIREIPVAVLSDDIEDFVRSAWVCYQGKSCWARSDGKTLTWFYDRKTGERLEQPAQYDWEPRFAELRNVTERNGKRFDNGPMFKKHTTFDCVLSVPEARWGGVYRFRTTSVISGDQLYGSLLHIKGLTGGILRGMPLRLCVRPVNVAPNGKATIVHCVYVDLLGEDLIALQNRALEIAKFQRDNRQQLLTVQREIRQLMHDPGMDEDEQTQSDVSQEFHPESEGEPENDAPSLDDLDEPETIDVEQPEPIET